MNLTVSLSGAILIVATCGPPVFAQQPAPPEERAARFDAADKNKDGKLDKAEWATTLPERAAARADQIWSARTDADGDGFVTKEQFLAAGPGRGGPPPPGQ